MDKHKLVAQTAKKSGLVDSLLDRVSEISQQGEEVDQKTFKYQVITQTKVQRRDLHVDSPIKIPSQAQNL